MIESLHRLVLFCIALALSAGLSIKSHDVPQSGGAVAFLPMGTSVQGKETIRIRGNIEKPGVYQIDSDVEGKTVTILTLAGIQEEVQEKSLAGLDFHSGDVLEITQKDAQCFDIKKETMTVEEGHVLSSVYEAASNSGKHYAASGKDCSSLAGNPFIASVMVSSVM